MFTRGAGWPVGAVQNHGVRAVWHAAS